MSELAFTQEDIDATIASAESAGFTVVQGNDYTLLLDLDTPEAEKEFEKMFDRLFSLWGMSIQEEWESKSGHKHVKICLGQPMPIEHRLILQLALGSDKVKEALSLARVVCGVREPSLLFRPPSKT